MSDLVKKVLELVRKSLELVKKAAELESACEELREDTYGGNGEAHWPDPEIQIDAKKKKHKDEVGIHIKREQYFRASKRVDYKKRNAVENITKAMKKIDDAMDIIAETIGTAEIEEENKD